jgi:hypothetical protein
VEAEEDEVEEEGEREREAIRGSGEEACKVGRGRADRDEGGGVEGTSTGVSTCIGSNDRTGSARIILH